jgi:hypothetical protein
MNRRRVVAWILVLLYHRGASPLELPDTLSREPRRRLAPFAWLAPLRALASSVLTPGLAVAAVNHDGCTPVGHVAIRARSRTIASRAPVAQLDRAPAF